MCAYTHQIHVILKTDSKRDPPLSIKEFGGYFLKSNQNSLYNLCNLDLREYDDNVSFISDFEESGTFYFKRKIMQTRNKVFLDHSPNNQIFQETPHFLQEMALAGLSVKPPLSFHQ